MSAAAMLQEAWRWTAGELAAWPSATIARTLLVLMFPFSALDKWLYWKDAIAQASSSIVPAALAPTLLVGGMLIETVLPVCIVGGWQAEPAAFLLAGYCVLTALLFHAFWRCRDFWASGQSAGRTHFWDFTKNLGLAGGLLLVAIGRGF